MSASRVTPILIVSLLITGCSTVRPQDAFREIQQLVTGRISAEVIWNQGTQADAAVEQRIKGLLIEPLTADTAVQVALLNNRNLQATYEEIGIAQADLVQAGLLKNPVLSIERRFTGKALELDIAQEVIDLLMIPLRRRVAGAAFEAAKLRVTDAVLDVAAEGRSAAFMLQAAEQMVEMRRSVLNTAEAASDLASRMHAAGNITDLDWRMEQRLARQARLELAIAEQEVLLHREQLTTLMGVWGTDTTWAMAPRLPDIPATDTSLKGLEALAMSQRLDLAASRQDIVTAAETLGITRALRFVSTIEASAHYEREPEGSATIGPSVSVAIPVFDWGQATVPRYAAMLRQKQDQFMALAIEIRSQVRAAYARMHMARERAAFYRTSVLPLQAEILRQGQLQYNAMQLNPLELFRLKQGEIDAGRDYIESLRDYWVARAELEHTLGGRLNATAPEGSSAPEPPAQIEDRHHYMENQ